MFARDTSEGCKRFIRKVREVQWGKHWPMDLGSFALTKLSKGVARDCKEVGNDATWRLRAFWCEGPWHNWSVLQTPGFLQHGLRGFGGKAMGEIWNL